MLGGHGGCIGYSKMRRDCYFLCYIFPYIFSLNCCYLFISQDIHRIMQCKYLLWTLGICDRTWTTKEQISLVYIAQFTSETTMSKYCDGVGIGLIRACNESTTQRTIQNQMNSLFMQSLSCFEDSGIVRTCFRG